MIQIEKEGFRPNEADFETQDQDFCRLVQFLVDLKFSQNILHCCVNEETTIHLDRLATNHHKQEQREPHCQPSRSMMRGNSCVRRDERQ